jgi:thioredoxin-like negative regulator of GroEL
LLAPAGEKAAFVAEAQSTLDEEREPVHTALARALLAGLAGDEKEGRAQLDRLLRLRAISPAFGDDRATAATRYWDFLLMAGTQLVAWQLDGLAAHLWKQSLTDEAAIALQAQLPAPQGESIRARVHEVRTRLAAIQLMRAEPEEFDAILATYARYAPPDGLLPLAETLEAMGGNAVAVTIYRRLWEQEPANPHALRNALSACRGVGDWIGLEEILTRVVNEGQFRQNDAAHRDLVQQLAEVLEKRQDFEHARAVLAEIADTGPYDPRLLLKLADLQERCSQRPAAEATYRKLLSREPTNIAARLSLAALLDRDGKTTSAIDLLERASGTEIDSRLAELNLKAGRLEEALGALERMPSPEHARAAQALADQLESKGDATRARYIIRAALARTSGDRTSFTLQSHLIQMLPTNAARALVDREVKRLRQLADVEGASTAEYFDLMSKEAERLGVAPTFQKELHESWSDGRGDIAAGVTLLAGASSADLDRIWSQVLKHPALNAPTLVRVIAIFEKRGDDQRRIETLGQLVRLDAEDSRRLSDYGRALAAAGRQPEGYSHRGRARRAGGVQPELVPQAAELYAKHQGAGESARTLRAGDCRRSDDSCARDASRLCAAAPRAARIQLCTRGTPLVQSQQFGSDRAHDRGVPQGTGHLDSAAAEIADIQFSARQRLELWRAIFAQLLGSQKVGAALTLAEENPQIMGDEQSSLLRKSLKESADFQRATTLLENVRAQGGEGDLAGALAELLAAWARAELMSLQVDSALAHLAKAH